MTTKLHWALLKVLSTRKQKPREWDHFVKESLSPNKNQKAAMFCTGGIRCEKASAHLLKQGFEEVYHLKGGILNYLEKN